MRLIPDTISPKVKSNAEKKFFELLRKVDLGPDWFCLHSVGLPEHEYKQCCEIDFLLVGPPGVFVLEVKGGQIACDGRVWYFTDRHGTAHRSAEGPFEQGRTAMFEFKKALDGIDSRLAGAIRVWGHGVVFPDSTFNVKSVEWEQKTVLDERACRSAEVLRGRLQAMVRYFQEKFPDAAPVSKQDLEAIRNALAPRFHLVQSLKSRADSLGSALVTMTSQQYAILDASDEEPRLLCHGGAGTGKTLVALENARMHARTGKKVLFLCFNPLLAAFLKSQAAEPGLTITALHPLLVEIIGRTSHRNKLPPPPASLLDPWYTTELPALFEAALGSVAQPQYDVLIVDEAQDVLLFPYMSCLDRLLVGGLNDGTWRLFFDPDFQAGIYGQLDPAVLEFLLSTHPKRTRLRQNCRNTFEIVEATLEATGGEVGQGGVGGGPNVDYVSYSNSDEQAEKLLAIIDETAEQLGPGAITVLTGSDPATLIMHPLLKQTGIRPLDRARAPAFPVKYPTACQIDNFKGLETDVIVVTDIQCNGEAGALSRLYVGMSRARVRLVLLLEKSEMTALAGMIRSRTKARAQVGAK